MAGGSRFYAVLRAVASALNDDGLSVMEHAVQDRGGKGAVVVEDGRPMLVDLVGGQDDGAAFVAAAEDLKEQVGAMCVYGQIAQFIHDQDCGPDVFFQFLDEASGALGGGQVVDGVNSRGETDVVPRQARGVTQGDAQVGLAQADARNKNRVGLVFNELEAKEVLDLRAVDFRRPGKIELLQGLDHWKAGLLDAPLGGSILAQVGFAFDEAAEEVKV